MQLRDHEAIKSKADRFRVDPRLLKVDTGFNVRDLDDAAERVELDKLKADIQENGVQDDLEIRLQGDDIYITSGHRRHRVVMELIAEGHEIATVPAVAEPKTVNNEERVLRLRLLNSGTPLTPLQNAEIVRRLIAFGWDRQRIAKRFGVTAQTIANYEDLLAAPQEVQQMIRDGEVSASLAASTVRTEGTEAIPKLREARTAAKAKGRTRVTAKSFAPPAAPVERPSAPVRNQADLDKSLVALLAIVNRSIEPDRLASAFLAMGADDVRQIIDWLELFEARLREQTEDAGPPAYATEGDIDNSAAAPL